MGNVMSIVEHLEVLPIVITMEVREEVGRQILENKFIVIIG
jgi:hypothetical protein